MSESERPTRAVLFDYGLVLTGPPDAAARAEMQRVLGANDALVQAAYWRYRDAYDRGAADGHGVLACCGGGHWTDPRCAEPGALIAADTKLWTKPNEAMIGWAARLQRAGIKTGILSNLGDEMETGVRARFAWLTEFAHHTFSHHLGIAKPDQAIYRHAAEGLGVEPAKILFVDDRIENIEGARGVGMVAVQYEGHEAFERVMEEQGLGWLLRV